MINVCVPVLKRYDLLRQMLLSLEFSTLRADVCILDNGRDEAKLERAVEGLSHVIQVVTPSEPFNVAESWNWFIQHVREERVIVNDDITFAPDSLALLLASSCELVWADGVGFSCFVIRDSCVKKIGLFDESISPGYAYYEDEDYLQRLDGRGTREPSARAENVVCGVVHHKSSTLQSATHDELVEHHRKFKIAQGNYAKKWGVVFS